jgi:hypothetical protein
MSGGVRITPKATAVQLDPREAAVRPETAP